ncbi:SurA N-terminal domain-containing protein [Streptacidiphilus anmyonensis]|uniref:SurA N-terminal domain-containing protein n=1 Tax=Streptacidiphilus anmyonensis TaxID=405782 RepID=UPI0005AA29F6|nr:SurA N-terminal domain-containing protein [Streptacidiphilus anmyonensis]
MNRTRTALFALLAMITAPGLAACSGSGNAGTVHTGAAAVVGGQRISVATVEDQVTSFRDAAPAQGSGTGSTRTFGQDSAGMPANVLAFLIQEQVVQSALAQKGLSVSATDVSAVEAPFLKSAGNPTQLTAEFVNQVGLPPEDLEPYFRWQAGVKALLGSVGGDTGKLTGLLQPVAAGLKISVNPRYGSWDATNLTLGNSSQPWIKQVSQDNAG